jgi:hypothetical protein
MTTCPSCGHTFVSDDTAAGMALKALGTGDSNMDYIRSQMPPKMRNKEIYNALGYLVRKGLAEKVGYGIYRRVNSHQSR